MVKKDNVTTEGFKIFPFGEKFIYYSTIRLNSYALNDLNVTLEETDSILDSDSMENIKKYNPEISTNI